MYEVEHFIDGARVPSRSGRYGEVLNPDSGKQIARVGLASAAEVADAVASARAAQPGWAEVNPQRRARVLMRFRELVLRDIDDLAATLTAEHGKTLADSRGDIERGLEVVEFAMGVPHLLKGEYVEGAGPGIDVHSIRQPLGVVTGITPFNFPAMVPMWKIAPAIACGNAVVLKPSERVPSLPLRLAELVLEAGAPRGLVNVVNGDREAVDALLEHPDVQAVGFVGSSSIAEYVYARAAAAGKRAQCFGSAKNHMVVMPDADLDEAADALVGAAFGTSGERCMAVSVAVPVGERTADGLVDALVARLDKVRAGPSTAAGSSFGPLITRAAADRVKSMITSGEDAGAVVLVDGRTSGIDGHPDGFFVGATLIDHVQPDMAIYREEIFGPVLSVVRVDSYEEALRLPTEHEFGNGVSIFTRDGLVARDFVARVNVGMVGVNVPIPVPVQYFTFGGWKRSAFGDLNQHGPDSIRFYTKTKTVTSRWRGTGGGPSFTLPSAND